MKRVDSFLTPPCCHPTLITNITKSVCNISGLLLYKYGSLEEAVKRGSTTLPKPCVNITLGKERKAGKPHSFSNLHQIFKQLSRNGAHLLLLVAFRAWFWADSGAHPSSSHTHSVQMFVWSGPEIGGTLELSLELHCHLINTIKGYWKSKGTWSLEWFTVLRGWVMKWWESNITLNKPS